MHRMLNDNEFEFNHFVEYRLKSRVHTIQELRNTVRCIQIKVVVVMRT